jgi:hypothetical protein
VAGALHEEYKAITDSGLLLQIDLASLNPRRALDIVSESNTAIHWMLDQGVAWEATDGRGSRHAS